MPSPIPASLSAAASSWAWVVEAGWMTSDLASPTLARCEKSFSRSMKRRPASRPPLMSKLKIEPQPLGRSFLASAWSGWSGSSGEAMRSTAGLALRKAMTLRAFSTCRAMRSGKVSSPCSR